MTPRNKARLLITSLAFLFTLLEARCGDAIFEAESSKSVVAPMTVTEHKEKDQDLKKDPVEKPQKVSGNKYIEVKQGSGEGDKVGGSATYTINIQEDGKYYFWARVWWIDSCGNSFGVTFDKGPTRVFGNDRTYKSWHWVKLKSQLPLKKGKRVLTVSNREDGIKIDQLLLTDDRQKIPVDIETCTTETSK